MGECMSLTKSPPPIVINAAMIVSFFGRRRSYWCLWHILSGAKIKGVLPFYPAQYVQKSDVDRCMIWQKNALVTILESVPPCHDHFCTLSHVKHVTLISVSTTSIVTSKCLEWCVRIQSVNWVRMLPVNWARRRCIRNEMRTQYDTPLIAIKMDHIHRQKPNRQMKRVTSNTPQNCWKAKSCSWCAQGENQAVSCTQKKASDS